MSKRKDDTMQILERLKKLIILSAKDHDAKIAKHSEELMAHIEKVLQEARHGQRRD
jgi:hypothetical protein